jgi:hypothetical protein
MEVVRPITAKRGTAVFVAPPDMASVLQVSLQFAEAERSQGGMDFGVVVVLLTACDCPNWFTRFGGLVLLIVGFLIVRGVILGYSQPKRLLMSLA